MMYHTYISYASMKEHVILRALFYIVVVDCHEWLYKMIIAMMTKKPYLAWSRCIVEWWIPMRFFQDETN